MTTAPNYINTLELLNSNKDAIHILFHNVFRLIRPVRRKYMLPVNCIVILNGFYTYHIYVSSLVSINGLFNWVKYYNKNRINWYVDYLLKKGYIIQSDVIKGIKYYRLSELGLKVMEDFNSSYQSVLSKFLPDHSISL